MRTEEEKKQGKENCVIGIIVYIGGAMISALHERNIRIWRDVSEEIETRNRTELNIKKKKKRKKKEKKKNVCHIFKRIYI